MRKDDVIIDKHVAAAQRTKEKKYWLDKLSGELVKSNFHYDLKPKNVDIRNFGKEEFRFTGELVSKFLQLSNNSDLRLHMILAAGLVMLIQKYTGQKDIIVGTPAYKEDDEDKFVNTVLALRNIIDTGQTFKDILVQVRQTILDAVEHVNYPVELLSEQLGMPVSNHDDFPLFDMVILLENIQDKKYIEHINYNIAFSLLRKEDGLEGVVEYNAHRYHKETIGKIINHFISIFQQVLFDVNLSLSKVDIISEVEKRQLLNEFNDTRVAFPKDKTIHKLFEEQAERTPGEIAVCFPIDLSDIFTAASCFKKNPYVFEAGLGAFKILKTNAQNSVVINENMLKLIDCFTGEDNLESIFSILNDFKNAKFVVFISEKKDLLGITHDFDRRAETFSNMNYNAFISLVQLLHKNALIKFNSVKTHTQGAHEIEPGHFELNESFENRTVLKDLIKYSGAGLVKADVLLLGDTNGMPTTGLLYMASFLRRNGVKTLCRFYDDADNFQSMEADIVEMLDRVQPLVVGISMKWFLYIARVIDMCEIVKEYSRRHGVEIKVVVGGNTAAYYAEEMSEYDCIDYLVRGDGEEPILKIFRGEKNIPNCIYRENGKIIKNPITYIQDEKNASEIYLSHLDEILLSNAASLFGTFFVYTQKGCAMNCLYCGGCNKAQQKTFNRKGVLRRGVEEVRKDIVEVKTYVSALQFEFDILDKNLADYCRRIWDGIDLSGHFCFFSTLTPPSTKLVELVSRTFKYVYWDFDICTPSERHRKQLESLRLVKPQSTDAEILGFMEKCERFDNIQVRPNLLTGLPYFTLEDIEPGKKLLSKIKNTFSCFGALHWARLHAQPGAPILECADQLQMHSFAASFEDFQQYSRETFNRDSGYVSFENFSYPYIYYKDEQLNSRTTHFYLEINKKINQFKNDKTNELITSETSTYREINERADRLAAALITRGVKPGHIVGIMLERSVEMIVGLLGILKAGGAYMPIEPDYPQERIDYMLKDSGAGILLTAEDLGEKKGILNCEMLKSTPRATFFHPGHLAYIIYTSGSTGKPKGVMVEHRQAVNVVTWFARRYGVRPGTRVLQSASFTFDASVNQIFGTLLHGASLHVVERRLLMDIPALRRYIDVHRVNIINTVPVLLRELLLFDGKLESLQAVISGADRLTEGLKNRLLQKGYVLYNHYGPTEATIDALACRCTPRPVTLGKPIANCRVYILDPRGDLQPIGVPGELHVAGAGVARGYLNNPGLTAERFNRSYKTHKSYKSYILYKTGDLARWLPDGNIEFLGRIDNQVKIRGYRIELGEIENRLTKHPAVEEAVVAVKGVNEVEDTGEIGNDDKLICAYIVPRGANSAAAPEEKTGDKNKQVLPVKEALRENVAQFENHVNANYDEIAVKSNGRSLTYGALNNAADRLAHRIQAEYDDRYKLSKNERIRYQRQMLLHGWGNAFQEKLKSTIGFVAGAGGCASPTIMQLALMGIGTIKICDFDKVELSDLNHRFLHDVERMGMNKAQSAKVVLERINPGVTVIPIEVRLTRDNVFEMVGDADIIFDMMDDPADKFILSECAAVKRIPHVIIAMAGLNGFASVLHTPHTPCYHCLFSKEKLDPITAGMENRVENYSKNPLEAVRAPLLIGSGTAVNEVLKILMGVDEPAYNKFFYFNRGGANQHPGFTPGFKSGTHLFSDHFRQISREQGYDWDDGCSGNLLEVLDIVPDPGCPLCSDNGKELRKALGEKIKEAAGVVNIEEKNEVKKGGDNLKTVGILLNHDIEMAAAIMATLKAGKSIVPLDPDSPEKSRLHVLEDSEVRVILTDDRHLEFAEILKNKYNRNIKIINIAPLNEPGPPPVKTVPETGPAGAAPGSVAYLLYPSGSKGNPGFNTAFTDLYTALTVTPGSYTFGSVDRKPRAGSTSLSDQLKGYLLEELPGFMVPSYFVQLDKIPLTPIGKVDRKALPAPLIKEKDDYTAPGNELEEKLVEMVSEVLGIQKDIIGIDTDFFRLGGHSLSATMLVSRIHKELNVNFPLAEFFNEPTIKGLSGFISGAEEETFVAIGPAKEKEYYKLSSAQKRLYVLQQMGDHNIAYNMRQEFSLSGDVDKEKLATIFNRLIARHETLRTSFEVVGGEPVQKVHDNIELKLQLYKTDEAGLDSFKLDFTRPFDLSEAPLLRVGLIEIECPSPYYYLLVEMHHIISDEVSQTLLQKEFMALNSGRELPPLKLQYKDFSEWENSSVRQAAVKKQETYWLKQFDGELPVLNLPLDFPRPAVQSSEGCTVSFYLPHKDSAALNAVARQEGATTFMMLLTAYNLFLAKLCSREDIVVGTPVAGRKHSDLEKIIGVFINSLALRSFPEGKKTVREFLYQVKTDTLDAFENQEYPFDDLVEKVMAERTADRNPIFDVMLNLINREDYLETIPGDHGDSYTHVKGRVRFDMNLVAVDFGERVFCVFFYCTALFKPETIDRFIGYFKRIASLLPGNLDRRIADIEIISEAEKHQLLYDFNSYESDYPRGKTIVQLFEEQVCRTPDSAALVFEDNRLTYRQLNEQANRLGDLLRRRGVEPGTLVGLLVQRSVEMVVGIWGILKSGGAYLPINPEAPGERITYMLENASVTILLTQEMYIDNFANRYRVINLNSPDSYKDSVADPGCKNAPGDLAYVIYTSGSTGKPKGVMIQNRSVINIVKWFASKYHLKPGFQLLQMFEYTFDASINQIFGSLLHGVTLHVIRKEYFYDIDFLRDYLIDHFINLINFVQSVIKEVLCGKEKIESLKHVISGAEKLKSTVKNEILDNGYTLYNQYGPTEVTVDALAEKCSYESNGTVGVPVYNAQCYIVNTYGRLNPVGVAGELWVSGDGLARGYINNVELTVEKFIPNPFIPGTRVYKTGDLTRWLPAENVEFLGRIDNQVKIRGFRIEPVEIAGQLVTIDGIEEAVVIDREDDSGDTYLCAYLVGKVSVDIDKIKGILAATLPDYMIPSAFVWIDQMPLSGHGKLIRSALPAPDITAGASEAYAAPGNPLEEKLVDIWAEVLNVDRRIVGVNSDFFELGGHSLRAVIMVSKIHKELDVRMPLTEVFRTPTVKKLAEYVKKSAKDPYSSLEAVEKKEYYDLSSAQKRIYIIDRMTPKSIVYNMPRVIRLGTSVDKQQLENVFRELINRHESLRTSFHMIDETPVQRIHDRIEFNVEYDEPGKKTLALEIHDFVRAFDLSTVPLLRGRVVKTGEGPHYLLVDMHHIISDGSSRVILDRDFLALYRGEKPPPLKLQYKDFSEWQNSEWGTERLRRQEEFWLKEFAGEMPVLDLPTDFPRPVIQSFEGSHIDFELDPEVARSLTEYVQNEGVTLYMMLLAAVNILLSKLSGREDIVIGTPMAGRGHVDLEKIIGMFINTLALRNSPAGCRTFREFLGDIKEKVPAVFENQEYPFEELVDKLSVKRDIGRNPLFDVMLVLQNFYMPTAGEQENEAPDAPDDSEDILEVAKFDLALVAVESGRRLFLSFQYCTKLFKKETVERFVVYFKKIVSIAVKEPGIRISEIEIVSGEEKKRILFDFNNTQTGYPGDKTIHQLFEEQVERKPDCIAVIGPSTGTIDETHPDGYELPLQITYRELNEKSNRLVHRLRKKAVGPGTVVGLKMGRSVEVVIAMLGILKAGSAYLPIDPDYPEDRINYMLTDSNAGTLLSESSKLSEPGNADIPIQPLEHSSAQLCYILYTSGSTGRPRGVMVEHRNVARLVKNPGFIRFHPGQRLLMTGSIVFDITTFEIWGPLLNGVPLVAADKDMVLNIEKLSRWVIRDKISVLHLIPQLFNQVVERFPRTFAGLEYFLVGGDMVRPGPVNRLRNLYPGLKIVHCYGPTENTTFSTTFRVDDDYESRIPIGAPINNSSVYILDTGDNVQPIGVVGELHTGGAGGARGYLNNPELTAGRFNGPYKSYKTGDLACWLPDGNVEFHGRIDQQVKIRGFRIEPGEIENRLSNCPGIKEAVVSVREEDGGDRYICAYIVSDREYGISELRELLSKELPDYMIPSYFVALEKIPLTPNGKIDRRALPKPELNAGESYSSPGNELEKGLVELWSEVLNIKTDVIGIDSDFFQLGGHSLKATVLISKIHKAFNTRIPLAEFFRAPTVREQAAYMMKGLRGDLFSSIEVAEKKEYYPLSSAQKRLYILQQVELESTGYNMSSVIPLAEEDIDVERLEQTFRKLIARHESLRTSFHVIDNLPVQEVHNAEEVAGRWALDIGECEAGNTFEDFIKPFDLSRAPLLRVGLIKTGENKLTFLLDLHHIITDGTSQGLLEREFRAFYAGKELPPLRFQYKDYAEWQNGRQQQEIIERQGKYWLDLFPGELPVLTLPTDFKRPLMQSFEGASVRFALDRKETEALKRAARENEVTLYMILLAVFNILLSKLSGLEDIIVGTPVEARRHADLRSIVGMFLNTLAMRNYPSGEKSFKAFLGEVKKRTLEAYENQEYPFEDLVDRLSVTRDTGRNPVFDVMFNLLNQADYTGDGPAAGNDGEETYVPGTSKFDLSLKTIDYGSTVHFSFEFCTKLFKKETVDRITGYFKTILNSVTENPDRKISGIGILPHAERDARISRFNEELYVPVESGTVQNRLSMSFQKYKDRIAVEHGTAGLSYSELDRRSTIIADRIFADKIEKGSFIGIYLDDRVEIVSAVLGIIKAGGVFVPLDPVLPFKRIENMIRLTNIRVLITDAVYKKRLFGGGGTTAENVKTIIVDDSFYKENKAPVLPGNKIAYQPGDEIYVYFTSGSTGSPNAVVGRNEGLLHFVDWEIDTFGIDRTFKFSQFINPGFDVFLRDTFIPLCAGGTICIPEDRDVRLNIDGIGGWIEENGIDFIHIVPSMFKLIVAGNITGDSFKNLKFVLLAGEKVNPAGLQKWYDVFGERIQLVNIYGPTETTLAKVFHLITGSDVREGKIPIGRAIGGSRTILLDRDMNICGKGIVGELYIRTPYRSHGYYNDPGLNRERFIPNPFRSDPDDLIYKTGDLGRELGDGSIEFVGRIDRQVKLRGIRIELGEVENALLNHEKIRDSVILLREDAAGEHYLCAYIVSDKAVKVSELREYMSKELPGYMVPSFFVFLDKLPLNPNGKIDRDALPEPVPVEAGEAFTAPRDTMEEKLAKIWGNVLGIEKEVLGIDGNFFELGGHSLKATILISRMHEALDVRVPLGQVFKTPTIRGVREYIRDTGTGDKFVAIGPVEEKEYYPLSSAQYRLYFLRRLDPRGIGYNMPRQVILDGKFEKERLERSFRKLIRRHESFRTSFEEVDGTPVQRIHDPQTIRFSLQYHDVTGAGNREETAGEVETIVKSFVKPFDLSLAPLLRLGVIKVAEEKHVLMLDMHHIISDGTSLGIFLKDLMAFSGGEELDQLPLQYKDFSEWRKGDRQRDLIEKQGAFWLKQMEGDVPVLNLPYDYARPAVRDFGGNRAASAISKAETEGLNALALKENVTLYMLLLGIFNVLLSKLSGQEDIIVGTPVAGRDHAHLQQIIGMFVNTLALRNEPAGELSFKEFLYTVKEKTLAAFENQEYPFEDLVEQVVVNRDISRNPLFDVLFTLLNIDPSRVEVPGVTQMPNDFAHSIAKFDLTLTATAVNEELVISFAYGTGLFKRETIERFISFYKNVVSSVLDNPGKRISEIEIIPDEERERLLFDFNNTETPYPGEKTIHRLFEEQVERVGDNIAVVGTVSVSYRELNRESEHLAQLLRARGVTPDTIVGLIMGRSVEMIVGILGILKAGGAYLPIDHDYPGERKIYMLEDSSAEMLITSRTLSEEFETAGGWEGKVYCIEELLRSSCPLTRLPSNRQRSSHLVYIIYTSGSTGKPKGVMVEHRSVVNLIHNQDKYFNINRFDRILQFSSICFDASVEQIFIAFSSGAALVLVDKNTLLDIKKFEEYVSGRQVTHIHAVPSFLNNIQLKNTLQLKRMIAGGDVCPVSLAKKWDTTCDFYNEYGPTETTVTSIEIMIKDTDTSLSRLPVGKPIGNTGVYILDRWVQPVPFGVIGGLHIGGPGVARGYLNRPGLTAEKFVENPFIPGQRMYKTGDLARWLPDGNIECLGRMDHQVKIRGFRIELGEIESRILKHNDVDETAVIVKNDENGEKNICAYIVSGKHISAPQLREYLAGKLPDYMIPSYFVHLDKLPLTPSGKVDSNALPGPEADAGMEYEAPRDEVEKKLVDIWADVLGIETDLIGINSNFFQLGGHSLRATLLVANIQKKFDVSVSLIEIFKTPTIKRIASLIKMVNREENKEMDPDQKTEEIII